jgi:hypothetical protein
MLRENPIERISSSDVVEKLTAMMDEGKRRNH